MAPPPFTWNSSGLDQAFRLRRTMATTAASARTPKPAPGARSRVRGPALQPPPSAAVPWCGAAVGVDEVVLADGSSSEPLLPSFGESGCGALASEVVAASTLVPASLASGEVSSGLQPASV